MKKTFYPLPELQFDDEKSLIIHYHYRQAHPKDEAHLFKETYEMKNGVFRIQKSEDLCHPLTKKGRDYFLKGI